MILKVYKPLVYVAVFIITFLSLYKNQFGVAAADFYERFQHGSESLVIGKIVADQNNLTIPSERNLAVATIGKFSPRPDYQFLYQGYTILDNKKLEDVALTTAVINDQNWIGGVSKNFSGVVINHDPNIDNYVGRKIIIDDKPRIITLTNHVANFTNIRISGDMISAPSKDDSLNFNISEEKIDPSVISLAPYSSNFGIQGIIFSKLYDIVKGERSILYMANAALFAFVIIALSTLYSRIFPKPFPVIFFLSISLSPWMTSFANNLYWISFSWLLPAIFSAGFLLSKSTLYKWLWLILLYFAFLFKCLAGYEYISTIILFAAAPYIYLLLLGNKNANHPSSFKAIMLVCIIGVAGFTTALLIHANTRGTSILAGLQSIYELDVKRRTYGNPSDFGQESFAALSSSPIDVLRTYIVSWRTELIRFFSGSTFVVLLSGAVLTIISRIYLFKKINNSDFALFIAFILPPVSWLVLAKGHSGVHTHMNFVLWYFGFVAAIFHICLNGLKIIIFSTYTWAKNSRLEDI